MFFGCCATGPSHSLLLQASDPLKLFYKPKHSQPVSSCGLWTHESNNSPQHDIMREMLILIQYMYSIFCILNQSVGPVRFSLDLWRLRPPKIRSPKASGVIDPLQANRPIFAGFWSSRLLNCCGALTRKLVATDLGRRKVKTPRERTICQVLFPCLGLGIGAFLAWRSRQSASAASRTSP